MSAYFDTSFLAPLIRRELTSGSVELFLRSQVQARLCTSHWARVEFSSVITRDVRMKVLTPDEAAIAVRDFAVKISPGILSVANQRE